MKASLLYPCKGILAEGPYWHKPWQSFLWVDIEKGILYRYAWESQKVKTWTFPHRLTLVIPDQKGSLILALDSKLARFNPDTEALDWLAQVEEDKPLNRFNDGACDAKGRLWAGTMSVKMEKNAGALYCMDGTLSPVSKISPVTISNGLAWSLDGKTLYYIDSPSREIKAYDFEEETGDIKLREVVVKVPEAMGTPDGMCADTDGNLWVGHYGGSGVYAWNPKTGENFDRIEVDAPHVTSCAFGGPDLDNLIITTARENLGKDQLDRYPESGSVFYCKMSVKGAPVHGFGF